MEYPKHHKQIVDDLMNGRFILSKESHFEELKFSKEFYLEFFNASFGYELIFTQEYAYLVSEETKENFSKDVSIFFAILCFELDKQGKNFLDLLEFSEFSKDEIEKLFSETSYIDLLKSNKQLSDREKRENLLNAMNRRNIIEKINDEKFFFTSAYKVFIDFSKELASSDSAIKTL